MTAHTATPAQAAPPADDRIAIERAVAEVYAAISGPQGASRDLDRIRALFTADARMTAITADGLVGGTVEDYIARSGAILLERGFTERQLASRIEQFGDLAQAWSSYEGTFANPDGSAGSVRGINSFQLVRQDGRWLVQSILWQAEGPGLWLPSDMLGD